MNKTKMSHELRRRLKSLSDLHSIEVKDLIDKFSDNVLDLKIKKSVYEGSKIKSNQVLNMFKSGLYTQSEISRICNLSRQRVSQIIKANVYIVDEREKDIEELKKEFIVKRKEIDDRYKELFSNDIDEIIKYNIKY